MYLEAMWVLGVRAYLASFPRTVTCVIQWPLSLFNPDPYILNRIKPEADPTPEH